MERAYPTTQSLPLLLRSLYGQVIRDAHLSSRIGNFWKCAVIDKHMHKHMHCKITVGFFFFFYRNRRQSARRKQLACGAIHYKKGTWLCGYWFIVRHRIYIRFYTTTNKNCFLEMPCVFTHTSVQKLFGSNSNHFRFLNVTTMTSKLENFPIPPPRRPSSW